MNPGDQKAPWSCPLEFSDERIIDKFRITFLDTNFEKYYRIDSEPLIRRIVRILTTVIDKVETMLALRHIVNDDNAEEICEDYFKPGQWLYVRKILAAARFRTHRINYSTLKDVDLSAVLDLVDVTGFRVVTQRFVSFIPVMPFLSDYRKMQKVADSLHLPFLQAEAKRQSEKLRIRNLNSFDKLRMVAVETRKVMGELRTLMNSRVRYRISLTSKLGIPRQLCFINSQYETENDLKVKAINQLKHNMQVLWDDYIKWKIEVVEPVLFRRRRYMASKETQKNLNLDAMVKRRKKTKQEKLAVAKKHIRKPFTLPDLKTDSRLSDSPVDSFYEYK